MPTGSSRRRSSQMPTGKRASMREGPLAALFRKTAEETEGTPAKPAPEAAAPPEPQPAAEPELATTPEPKRRGHPSLRAPSPPEPEEELRLPSPQERLRHAFSADIPENVLERPKRRRGPVQDVYARPERDAEAFAPEPG